MGRQPTGAGVARTMDKLGHTYHLCAYGVRKLRLNCRFKTSGDCVCGPAKLRRVGEMERLGLAVGGWDRVRTLHFVRRWIQCPRICA